MTLLGAPETAFVLVTTPRRDAVEEGEYFAERLTEHGMTVEGLIVNRVHPPLRPRRHPTRSDARASTLAPSAATPRRDSPPATPTSPTSRRSRRASVASSPGSKSGMGNAAVAHVPELDHDVFDFAALRAVGRPPMD